MRAVMKKQHMKAGSSLMKKTKGEMIIYIIVFVLFTVYGASLVAPFLWLIMNSLKDGTEYAIDVVLAHTLSFPDKLLFSNYVEAFKKIKYDDVTFLTMLGNSLIYVIPGNIITILTDAAAGYVVAKYRFRGRSLIYSLTIICMTIPIIGNLAASFRLRSALGLYDNLFASVIFLSFTSFGFYFLIMYSFFKPISWEYAEAVFIDGGGHYTVFFKIMLPMSTPLLVTIFIMRAIGSWNDYEGPLLYLPSYPGIATGLYMVSGELTRGAMSVYYAALVLAALPVLILYAIFSDKIMQNFTIGGLKG